MFSDKLNKSQSEPDIFSQFNNLSLSSSRSFSKPFQNSCSSIVRCVYAERIVSGGEEISFNTRYSAIDEMSYAPRIDSENKYTSIEDRGVCEEVPMEIDNSSYNEERFPKMMGSGSPKTVPRLRKFDFIDLSKLDENEHKHVECSAEEKIETRVTHTIPQRKNNCTNRCLILIAILVPLLLFSYYFNDLGDIFFNTEVQIDNIRIDLKSKVHMHTHLVDRFVKILGQRSNWSKKLKIISFVGSQGVGKTFFASLVKKHFPLRFVHDVYGAHLYYSAKRKDILDKINSCCLNLIVIDDLKLENNIDLFAFIHSLPKETFILLITIFNTHYTEDNLNTVIKKEDIIKVRHSFDSSGIKNHELFIFKDFTSGQIKDWMKRVLNSKNISSEVGEEIAQNILDTHDINHGLKGLNSKMVLELEKYKK